MDCPTVYDSENEDEGSDAVQRVSALEGLSLLRTED